jgi:hypothetical protein
MQSRNIAPDNSDSCCYKTMGGASRRAQWALALLGFIGLALAVIAAPGGFEDKPAVLLVPPAFPIEKTYIFSNSHWWESVDHQLTTLITLLTLAKNSSAIAVLPAIGQNIGGPKDSYSLIGDFYDIEELRKVQPVMTTAEFKRSKDFTKLKATANSEGGVTFPKSSQETFEKTMTVLSEIGQGAVTFGMPNEDPENTNMFCSRIPGDITLSDDGKVRFIFLDRIHFYHFCTERHMPWWYDVRMHIVPRREYITAAEHFMSSQRKPLIAIHIRDAMDEQRERSDEEIERYALQIADAMRRKSLQRIDDDGGGTMYLSYEHGGRSVARVAELFETEFPTVRKCADLYMCGNQVGRRLFDPPLDEVVYKTLFSTTIGPSFVEVALCMSSQHFVGNAYSPASRNIGLYRKLHGSSYEIVKGFAEMKRLWKWSL